MMKLMMHVIRHLQFLDFFFCSMSVFWHALTSNQNTAWGCDGQENLQKCLIRPLVNPILHERIHHFLYIATVRKKMKCKGTIFACCRWKCVLVKHINKPPKWIPLESWDCSQTYLISGSLGEKKSLNGPPAPSKSTFFKQISRKHSCPP